MKCSFEIPTAHVKELREHMEYDFTLAHMWLSSEAYRTAYGPGSVMDNGMFELGEPLEIGQLTRAVRLARPTVVIAPDFMGDADRTRDAWRLASARFDCEVAGVLQGKNVQEMVDLYRWYRDQACEIICFPFRTPRVEILKAIAARGWFDGDNTWYHFLGLNSMEELEILKSFRLQNSSVDTSKPIKAAIYHADLHAHLRGHGRIDMEAVYDTETVERMRFNMDRFREIAQND